MAQYKAEGQEILSRVRERFKEFGIELNQAKTKMITFGYWEKENARKQQRRANTFDFLGFTHYCSQTRKGAFKVGRKTSARRFSRSYRAIGLWLKSSRNMLKLKYLWRMLRIKLTGHYQYYGISDNWQSLEEFYRAILRLAYKWINRRSQKQSFNWEEFTKYLRRYPLPTPRIVYSFYN